MSKHTVPAMRHLVAEVRARADQIMRDAEAEAAELRAAADEIEADANAKEGRQQPAAPAPEETSAPCRACGQQLVRDELGWRHLDLDATGKCAGTTPPVPAPPTAPWDTVPDEGAKQEAKP